MSSEAPSDAKTDNSLGGSSWPAPVRRIITSHQRPSASTSEPSKGTSSAANTSSAPASATPGNSVTQYTSLVPLNIVLDGQAAITPLFSHLSVPSTSAPYLSTSDIDAAVAAVPGVVLPNGVNGQITELKPNFRVGMHRTSFIDYNIMVAGSAWHITPDPAAVDGSGEKRELVRVGDVVIQRGTMHAWQAGPEGARWFCIVVSALPVVIDGKELPDVAF